MYKFTNNKGQKRGFVWPGMCAVNRDCKVPPIRKYNAALSPDTISYVGISRIFFLISGSGKVSRMFSCLRAEK